MRRQVLSCVWAAAVASAALRARLAAWLRRGDCPSTAVRPYENTVHEDSRAAGDLAQTECSLPRTPCHRLLGAEARKTDSLALHKKGVSQTQAVPGGGAALAPRWPRPLQNEEIRTLEACD